MKITHRTFTLSLLYVDFKRTSIFHTAMAVKITKSIFKCTQNNFLLYIQTHIIFIEYILYFIFDCTCTYLGKNSLNHQKLLYVFVCALKYLNKFAQIADIDQTQWHSHHNHQKFKRTKTFQRKILCIFYKFILLFIVVAWL